MKSNLVLYIGGFILPDKNAAAQRVLGIAKMLRTNGKEVVFFSESREKNVANTYMHDGFEIIEKERNELDYLFFAQNAIRQIKLIHPDYVIAYNYPSIALLGIRNYCKRKGIKVIADVTEWYEPNGNFIRKLVMSFDISFRMRVVHKKLDGVIAISKFLYEYYSKYVRTVLIPPVVDTTDSKWNCSRKKKDASYIHFIYAGVPSKSKERLDLITNAIACISKSYSIWFDVIGITEKQYNEIYGGMVDFRNITFHGRIPHDKVIEYVTNADWVIVLRDNTRLVKAGFPTKVVESITCGTPLVINDFSNVLDYLDETNCITTSFDTIQNSLIKACSSSLQPDKTVFDYHKYLDKMACLFQFSRE